MDQWKKLLWKVNLKCFYLTKHNDKRNTLVISLLHVKDLIITKKVDVSNHLFDCYCCSLRKTSFLLCGMVSFEIVKTFCCVFCVGQYRRPADRVTFVLIKMCLHLVLRWMNDGITSLFTPAHIHASPWCPAEYLCRDFNTVVISTIWHQVCVCFFFFFCVDCVTTAHCYCLTGFLCRWGLIQNRKKL